MSRVFTWEQGMCTWEWQITDVLFISHSVMEGSGQKFEIKNFRKAAHISEPRNWYASECFSETVNYCKRISLALFCIIIDWILHLFKIWTKFLLKYAGIYAANYQN